MYIYIRRRFAFLFAMKKLPKIIFGLVFGISLLLSSGINLALAQDLNSIGIATYLPVQGKVEDAEIISSTSNGYGLSKQSYDPQIIGVVALKPAIALKTTENQNGIPVVSLGQVTVKINGQNGNIKKGEFVTTSDTPGIGMKATRNGFVVGQALENTSFNSKTETKIIAVDMNLHFFQTEGSATNSLLNIFQLSQLAAYEQPLKVFKYVVSSLVLIISFGFGFLIFSKAINTGIQALGRNPLAGRMIQLSIIFNVILVIIIIITGIGVAWLFLRI